MVSTRQDWLDHLRGVACLMVLMVHVAGIYLYQWGKIDTVDWQLANFLDSASRACVPIFFMLSGYLFFQDKIPKAKNFIKIISALLFYSLIYLLAAWFVTGVFPVNKVANILTTPVHYHLWFFYAIFIMYALSMLVRVRNETSPLQVVVLLLVLLIVFNTQWADIMVWFGFSLKSSSLLGPASMIYYFIYAVLAVYLAKLPVYGHHQNKVLLGLYGFCVVVIATATYLLSSGVQHYVGTFYAYNSVPVFLSAFALFVLFRHWQISSGGLRKALVFLSKYSLGIYGSHVFFLEIFQYILFPRLDSITLKILLVFGLTLICSCVFSVLIRRLDKKAYLG